MHDARLGTTWPLRIDPRLALSLACGALLLVAWTGESWLGLPRPALPWSLEGKK